MSKKKKKLNKKLIQERLRELESSASVVQKPKTEEPLSTHRIKTDKTIEISKKEPAEDADQYIRHDIRKVLIVTGVIILIFVVLYFANLKTNYILDASNWIFSILHVGQL